MHQLKTHFADTALFLPLDGGGVGGGEITPPRMRINLRDENGFPLW